MITPAQNVNLNYTMKVILALIVDIKKITIGKVKRCFNAKRETL